MPFLGAGGNTIDSHVRIQRGGAGAGRRSGPWILGK